MNARSRHYGLIPAGIILLAAILAFADIPHDSAAGIPASEQYYENTRFGFALSYPAGSTGAIKPDTASVSFARNGAVLEIDVYEPPADEKGLSLPEFVARTVDGADLVGPTQLGDQEAMVAVFQRGMLRIGGGIRLAEQSDVIFVKRPSYFVYAVLRGGTIEERRELAAILQSIRFQ